jgi:hypothetical protein
MTRNKMAKEKELRNHVRKIKKKKYCTFPDHLGVQPIPSTISSLTLDSHLEGCSTILGTQLSCLSGFS